MSAFDSIVVGNDLVSEHWLAEQFPATVRGLRAAWKEREDHDKPTPRSGITALSATFGSRLMRLREHAGTGRELTELRELHTATRVALQFPGDETVWTGERGGAELSVTAVAPGAPTAPPLLVLQSQDAATVEDLLDADGNGHLLTPVDLGSAAISSTATAISEIFQCEEPPSLILVTAGAWLLLAERGGWPEGRWLAIDLATVCDRRDTRAAGELETAAGLVSGDALLPRDDGSILFLDLLAESVKHAVGVSQDLRDGIRESIEILATDVLRRRRERGQADDQPNLARELTLQCLRYLYRILFLLYAEARPELGVLPAGIPEYSEGYGLDRLRELVLTELTTEDAAKGTHVYQSLSTLFRLVNDGYPPETLGDVGTQPADTGDASRDFEDQGELRFEALRADLFSKTAVALIDDVQLGNRALLQVLGRLLLSKKQRGRDRGFVSYAQLGINQLGAVYEGLMSYTGSLASVPSVEVAKDGDRSKGSWVVPTAATEGFDDNWFVQVLDPETGLERRITYAPGDFVFRLSGYERQRSASYYTPETLTRLVVSHSLAELLDQDGKTPAEDLLNLTICEPALGSGAFLVEAVRQLAEQYLHRRQGELGERVPAEDYAAELQRVKAHIALHQCYGVDLNATAVELAEITLWLDAMHPGLRAPWFGLHLRRGNSLIGARREVYGAKQLAQRAWLTAVPAARPLGTPLITDEVHHFLLPAVGWGAVADAREVRDLAPDARAKLVTWRRSVTSSLTTKEQKRFSALAQRVEVLWGLALRRLQIAESEARRHVDIWGIGPIPSSTGAVKREQIEDVLADPNGAYQRLHRVMDAWAALWSWPVTSPTTPPTRSQWLDALESLLGTTSKAEAKGGRGLFSEETTWADLDEAEVQERAFGRMTPVEEILARPENAWLQLCELIAGREGYFHWELTFGSVFAEGGGFALQLGNPPWVRPDWDDALTLAEDDAWFGLVDRAAVDEVSARRTRVLVDRLNPYLDSRAAMAGLSEHLGSAVDRPVLAGLRPDLYRCFMDRAWKSMAPTGIVGLIHPESHFTESRAGALRRATYRRLRRHWHFRNELKLFTEIKDTINYSVNIYGADREPAFLNAASLYHPDTVLRSLTHDGSGPEPGIKDENDNWDVRPHARRIVAVDDGVLRHWAALVDAPGTAAAEARMLLPVTISSQLVLDRLAEAPRLDQIHFQWTSGWNETTDRKRGFFVRRSAIPDGWDQAIIQGPHFTVATPLAQTGNPTMRSNQDYTKLDLEELPERFIPRTNYQPAVTGPKLMAGYPRWNGEPSNALFRLGWRRMANSANVRTLHSAIIPPGAMHVHGVLSLGDVEPRDLAICAGMWASLPVDFLVKTSGTSEINQSFIRQFPHPAQHPLCSDLMLRSMRLNCLTSDFAALWEATFESTWQEDAWTRPFESRAALGAIERVWTKTTPLRSDAERRQALVEIDALAAVMLNITAEELCAIYRTQFGVLRKYERVMQMDANGRQVSREVLASVAASGNHAGAQQFERPFTGVDREREMTVAHMEFSRRLRERLG